MFVDFVKARERYTFAPSKCLFLNDLSLRIYLGKINHTFSKNLDFTMLPRIKTKTNLTVPYLKNALMRRLFDNAYIPRWLFTLKKHFVESNSMLFYEPLSKFIKILVRCIFYENR